MRRGPIPYSDQEMAWLEANRMMIISDYHRAFVSAFGRDDVTAANLHQLRKRKKWKVGRQEGRFKGRHLKFSAEEIGWLRENCKLILKDYHQSFCERFQRHDTSAEHLHALRKREGWKTGRTGQFEKGSVPANKGKICPDGTGGRHPNARRTQFKKGQVSHTYRGAGHERIDDGYVIIIVDEKNPWTGASTRPVHKHRWLWERANGPVPVDHVLKCLDGDKTNCDPSNWEVIPRGVLPHLSARFGMHFDDADPALKPTIMAVAKLKHAVKRVRARKEPPHA